MNTKTTILALSALLGACNPSVDGTEAGDDTPELPMGSGEQRAADQLLADWTFDNGSGNTVDDISDVQNKLPLIVKDPAAVTWGDGFLTITAPTILEARTELGKIPRDVQLSSAITIEAWVSSAGMEQGGPAQIVALARSNEDRDFFLGQAGPSVEVDLTHTNLDVKASTSLYSEPVTTMNEVTHLVFTRDPDGLTRFYVNGELDAEGDAPGIMQWPVNGVLSLGNAVGTENRAWLGTYYRVAIYARALNEAEVTRHFGIGPE